VGGRKGIVATTYPMQTFQEFRAKKAMVLPNLFRIEPFIGLAQPIPLKPTIKRTVKPRSRLGAVRGRRVNTTTDDITWSFLAEECPGSVANHFLWSNH
jgi:hypothetical protein